MNVRIHRPVKAHGVRLREDLGVVVGLDEADEHRVSRLHVDHPAVLLGEARVVDGGLDLCSAVRAEGAVHADRFHEVAEDLVVGVGGV